MYKRQAFGFLFFFQNGIQQDGDVFRSCTCDFCSDLKALFEKQWESIVGNCDEFLYLGGNEQRTHKYVSELLGDVYKRQLEDRILKFYPQTIKEYEERIAGYESDTRCV